jgi:atypical dual specificity phosphatase
VSVAVRRGPAVVVAAVIVLTAAPARAAADERSSEEDAMLGFSWVADDLLAALPRPGAVRPLDYDLSFLAGEGITLLVSLTEEPTDADALGRHGIRLLHLPVADFTAPTLEQLQTFVTEVEAARTRGDAIGVHCAAGLGRTGTFAAAWLIARGLSAAEAIAEIRRLRPGSVETAAQEKRLVEFAARR